MDKSPWILSSVGDELSNRPRGYARRDNQGKREVPGSGDRRKVPDGVVRQVLQQAGISRMGGVARREQSVTIRSGTGHLTSRDQAVGAWLIVYDDRLAESYAQLTDDNAGYDIGAAAGGKGRDDNDHMVGIGLGKRRAREHQPCRE